MPLAGKGGKIVIGTNTITSIQSWSLEPNADMLETTALTDDWKTYIAGLKEWTVSAEGQWNVVSDVNGQKAIQDAYLNGTSVTVKLYVNDTNYYSGTAFISGLSIEDPVDDVVSFSMEFQGSGALAYT